ncbi:hypothetical protein BH23GEM8_BH23GEM8_22580 [soil metagenome]
MNGGSALIERPVPPLRDIVLVFEGVAMLGVRGDPLQARNTLFAGFANGTTYFNLHTTQFPGGEIRGQLLAQSSVVPELISMVLLGTGLAGLGALRRRRHDGDDSSTSGA